MTPDSSSLDELLEQEKTAHAIQISVLNKREFVEGALKGLTEELGGNPGKLWRELKAELTSGQLRS